jgi:glutamate 5-kinase
MLAAMSGQEHARAERSADSAALIGGARRITVKIGSSLLANAGSNGRSDWLASVADDLRDLREQSKHLLVVSSGAVAMGRTVLGGSRSARLDRKQAAAAIGQPLLMQAWREAAAGAGLVTAQLLLTLEDTESRTRWSNARATVEALLGGGVLPIVNENDTVATEELRYGDNDRLSARVAQLIRSDVLILLSDVDGLYTADPRRDSGARHIAWLDGVTAEAEAWAGGASASGPGTGGMRTKLAAARIAERFGCSTIIASGQTGHPLRALMELGAHCTVIEARASSATAYKQWIAGTLTPAGNLIVDDGAARALASGRSLLPVGVLEARGSFEAGACVLVVDGSGRELARGISRYSSAEARLIIGRKGAELATRLGYEGPDELIHRDDLVLL